MVLIFPPAPVIGSAIHPDFTPTCIHYACIVIKWSHNARPVVELMRPCSPRCECGLIILLSSSNKAVGEINAHEKRRWDGGESMCVGDLRHRQQMPNLSLRKQKKWRGKEGGREDRMERWAPLKVACGHVLKTFWACIENIIYILYCYVNSFRSSGNESNTAGSFVVLLIIYNSSRCFYSTTCQRGLLEPTVN